MTRRRQPNVEGGRTRRREVWVTPEQDVVLQQAADRDGVTVPRFLAEAGVAIARAEDAAGMVETPTQRRAQLAELFALRHTLAEVALQAKRVGVNVNQVARGVHTGQPVPVEEMRGYLTDERALVVRSKEVAERIDVLIDSIAGQGVDV